jgi:mycofactocin system creatininase family protein
LELESLTSGAVTGSLLVVPLGATEQHGPHLPLGTDTIIASALAASVDDAVVAPALPYGSSGEHAGFAGTLSLGQEALEHAVVELVRSADAFAGVAVVCWHGGNAQALDRAARRLAEEGRSIRVWLGRHAGADLHAGRTETSLVLHLAPELVGDERPVGATEPWPAIAGVLRTGGVRAVSPSGVLGDARGASADEGRRVFAELVADLDAFLG